MTHIYVGKLNGIGSDNGLSPDWRQASIRINAGIMLIGFIRKCRLEHNGHFVSTSMCYGPIQWGTAMCLYVSVLCSKNKELHIYVLDVCNTPISLFHHFDEQFFMSKGVLNYTWQFLKMSFEVFEVFVLRYSLYLKNVESRSPMPSCYSVSNRAPSQYKDRLIYVWRFPC